MSSPTDKWYFDENDKVVAGVILYDGKLTVVGEVRYVPQKFGGMGLGRQEKKIRDLEFDAEGPLTLEDVFSNLVQE